MNNRVDGDASGMVDGIMQVMEAAFDPTYREAWNRRQVSDALLLPSTNGLLINSDGNLINCASQKPVGFILSRKAADEEELLLIAILPEFRGKKLGEKLIRHFFNAAHQRGIKNIFLEMRRGNPAIKLYQKVGFKPIGVRSNYYRTNEGDLIDAITCSYKL